MVTVRGQQHSFRHTNGCSWESVKVFETENMYIYIMYLKNKQNKQPQKHGFHGFKERVPDLIPPLTHPLMVTHLLTSYASTPPRDLIPQTSTLLHFGSTMAPPHPISWWGNALGVPKRSAEELVTILLFKNPPKLWRLPGQHCPLPAHIQNDVTTNSRHDATMRRQGEAWQRCGHLTFKCHLRYCSSQ